MDVKTTIIEAARRIKSKVPDAKVYLFGSRARGDAQKFSDIDIAFDKGDKLDSKSFLELQEELENLDTFYPVQIVDMKDTSEKFYKKVMAYAKEINI